MGVDKAFEKGCFFSSDGFRTMNNGRLKEEVAWASGPTDLTITKPAKDQTTITYKFLPYLEGSIHYCESGGLDVISSHFSGCVMSRYKEEKGSYRVCHVCLTGEGKADDCREKWDEIQKRAGVSDVIQFKPADHWSGSFWSLSKKSPIDNQIILGLITSESKLFGIRCLPKTIHVEDKRPLDEIKLDKSLFVHGQSPDQIEYFAKLYKEKGIPKKVYVVESKFEYK